MVTKPEPEGVEDCHGGAADVIDDVANAVFIVVVGCAAPEVIVIAGGPVGGPVGGPLGGPLGGPWEKLGGDPE